MTPESVSVTSYRGARSASAYRAQLSGGTSEASTPPRCRYTVWPVSMSPSSACIQLQSRWYTWMRLSASIVASSSGIGGGVGRGPRYVQMSPPRSTQG